MNKLLIGFLIGWTLNIGFREYQNWEYANLEVDALELGLERNLGNARPIEQYIEANRTRVLDKINYSPNFWACINLFEIKNCPNKKLIRKWTKGSRKNDKT